MKNNYEKLNRRVLKLSSENDALQKYTKMLHHEIAAGKLNCCYMEEMYINM